MEQAEMKECIELVENHILWFFEPKDPRELGFFNSVLDTKFMGQKVEILERLYKIYESKLRVEK